VRKELNLVRQLPSGAGLSGTGAGIHAQAEVVAGLDILIIAN